MTAMTLTEKILARHAGRAAVRPDDSVWIDVDVLMTHDVCGPGTIGVFKQHFGKDARVWDRDKVVIIPDHYIFTADGMANRNVDVLRQFVREQGLPHFYDVGTQRYKGLELSVSKRLADRWQLLGSYVWSRLDGDLVVDPNNPNFTILPNATGRGANDQPHAIKVIGAYVAPYHVLIGINYQGRSGLPFDRTFRATLAQGATTVRAESRGVYRADFLNLLSLKVDKTFELHRHARVSAFFELHNLTNTNAAQGSIGTLTQSFASQEAFDKAKSSTSYFSRVQEIVAPRIAKFGVKYVF